MTPILLAVILALAPDPIEFRSGVAVSGIIKAGRTVIRTDPVEAAIVSGTFASPTDGQAVGDKAWKAVEAADGSFPREAAAEGYLFTTCESSEPRIMLLEARGHGMVYVNGEPFTGNPYATDYYSIPVPLRKGVNTFLFGGLRDIGAKLVTPPKPVFIAKSDATMPDVVADMEGPLYGAVVLVNAMNVPVTVTVAAEFPNQAGHEPIATHITLPAASTRKQPLLLSRAAPKADPDNPQRATLRISLEPTGGVAAAPDTRDFLLNLRSRDQTRSQTFKSAIDGSVQYFSVVPPVGFGAQANRAWPLVLSLHGASVEAISQANAYSSKSWCAIACPTNRRPYGFDWEDWGRKDAYEALERARQEFLADPTRIYLTGHSMGGHGAWQLGVHDPDTFAAIAPSAGWDSFWSYRGSRPDPQSPAAAMIRESGNDSDSSALLSNLVETGVAILHGDADDNVPVREARDMRDKLRALGIEPVYHEQPGAGHWWENSDEPGAECLDWPAFFDVFAHRRVPAPREVRRVRLATFNPAVTSRRAWATILAQHDSQLLSTIDIQCDPHQRRFIGTTSNVERLCLRADPLIGPGASVTLKLDEQNLHLPGVPADGAVYLAKVQGAWGLSGPPDAALKGPTRAGPFKTAFDRRFVLVRGTSGTPEETAWADSLTRYHAQTWWIRGNGTADVMTDVQWLAKPDPTRNVILYGHADMNAAWPTLRSDCPVSVRRAAITVGERTIAGDDVCVYFAFPMAGSDDGLVGVIAPTGPAGSRLAVRSNIFTSGVGIPDFLAIDSKLPAEGAGGIVGAGFFGHDWSVGAGRFAWR